MPAKLTPWFPASTPPVRPGVYNRNMEHASVPDNDAKLPYAYWTGKHWLCSGKTPEKAAAVLTWNHPTWDYALSAYQNLPWRGFTTEQK